MRQTEYFRRNCLLSVGICTVALACAAHERDFAALDLAAFRRELRAFSPDERHQARQDPRPTPDKVWNKHVRSPFCCGDWTQKPGATAPE